MKQSDPHIEDKLLDFAYGELPQLELEAVEAHLKSCAACSEALDQIQGVRRVMSRLPVETAPETGLESLLGYAEQAARRTAAGPAKKRGWWGILVPALGLGALAIIGVVVARPVIESTRSGAMEPDIRAKTMPMAAPEPLLGPAPPAADVPRPVELAKNARDEDARYASDDAKEAKVQAVVASKAPAPATRSAAPAFAMEPPPPPPPPAKREEREPGEKTVVAERLPDLSAPADKDTARGHRRADEAGANFQGDELDQEAGRQSGLTGSTAGYGGLGTSGSAAGGGAVAQRSYKAKKAAPHAAAKPDVGADDGIAGQKFAELNSNYGPAPAGAPAQQPAANNKLDVVSESRAEAPRPVATAAAPASPPKEEQKKGGEGWAAYWRQAQDAKSQGDFVHEAIALRNAVKLASGEDKARILDRLCEIEWDTRGPGVDCKELEIEFPNSPWAHGLASRKARARNIEMEDAEVGGGKKGNATAAPAARPASPAKASDKAATDMQ